MSLIDLREAELLAQLSCSKQRLGLEPPPLPITARFHYDYCALSPAICRILACCPLRSLSLSLSCVVPVVRIARFLYFTHHVAHRRPASPTLNSLPDQQIVGKKLPYAIVNDNFNNNHSPHVGPHMMWSPICDPSVRGIS